MRGSEHNEGHKQFVKKRPSGISQDLSSLPATPAASSRACPNSGSMPATADSSVGRCSPGFVVDMCGSIVSPEGPTGADPDADVDGADDADGC